MDKLEKFFEEKMAPFFGKLARIPFLIGLRNGMMATVPITIIGSIFLVMQQLPIGAWQRIIAPFHDMLEVPNMMTMGIIALYTAYSLGYYIAEAYEMDSFTGGLLSFAGFMMLQIDKDFSISTAGFGSKGIFTAIIVAIFSVFVLRICVKKSLYIKFPDTVPPAVSQSFAAIVPGAIIITVLFLTKAVFGIDIQATINAIFAPLVFGLNTLPGIVVFMFVAKVLWCFGIHGMSVMNAVGMPIFLTYLAANNEAYLAGEAIPYITAQGFVQCFVSHGGAGATLGLAILMLLSKEKGFKTFGKLTIVPAICNINEPIIFGYPIVMNPMMMIPFIVSDLVLTISTYLLMYFNIIGRPVLNMLWILPTPISSFLAAGNDIRAAIWSICGIFISVVIYYPFFKIEEKNRLKLECGGELDD
ncbi:PTS sugar transporter subunit IIC [Paratissierella segnis]|jgi:PTS system cellobiose-specific IIC component|uniref:Permease IIC component n=1 Tax=Paratissierella segnis TaxID=2763679 RepID=A0A926ESR2_9FIRM|nr:PTS transporter subunit EIIC [Paratissierella segnis]MBC8589083.1 PTS sugar transporter subunit IIC [Paratissierella segnis]